MKEKETEMVIVSYSNWWKQQKEWIIVYNADMIFSMDGNKLFISHSLCYTFDWPKRMQKIPEQTHWSDGPSVFLELAIGILVCLERISKSSKWKLLNGTPSGQKLSFPQRIVATLTAIWTFICQILVYANVKVHEKVPQK